MQNKLGSIVRLKHIIQSYPEIQADTALDIARNSLTSLVPLVSGNFCIEDSGLQVDALNGFPGPYSSYVFRTIGWQGILDLLQGTENRKAHFISVIGLYWNREIYTFEGRCEGTIANVGAGKTGFGFDPIFIPDAGSGKTFAEMEMASKNNISHRSLSTKQLLDFLRSTDQI